MSDRPAPPRDLHPDGAHYERLRKAALRAIRDGHCSELAMLALEEVDAIKEFKITAANLDARSWLGLVVVPVDRWAMFARAVQTLTGMTE